MNESRDERYRPDRFPNRGPAYYAERVALSLHERRAIDRLEHLVAADDPSFAALFTAEPAPKGAGRRRRVRFWRRKT